MSEASTLVVTATPNPNEAEALQAYFEGVRPLLMGAGGKLVKRLRIAESISGTPDYRMLLVMDFESKDAITKVFASEEYAALLPNREKGFTSIVISIGGDA